MAQPTINRQLLGYAPVVDYSGTDSFTYTIGHGHGNINTAIITIELVVGDFATSG